MEAAAKRGPANWEYAYGRALALKLEVRPRGDPERFPDVFFSDPRVKVADMTGDGLQDIVLIHQGRVEYWPYRGYGRWGARVTMANAPRLEDAARYGGVGYDPKRVLLGDVVGEGCADLVYVGSGHLTVWINQGGNGFSDAITIRGTPSITDLDAVRLADMEATGTAGILWSYDHGRQLESTYKFLDLTGGQKPYLLTEVDNNMGAITRIEYASSTRFYLEDERRPETRWKTKLPFPVQVVARVESIDAISGAKHTTEYSYHHGYWDGVEREFRGFGRVDQRDSEIFEDYNAPSAHPNGSAAEAVPAEGFSPPTETRTWFHQGALDGDLGEPEEVDHRREYWEGDPSRLPRPSELHDFLAELERPARRSALRSLRGRVLRTELYARDGPPNPEGRPYTVTEHLHGVMPLPVGQPWPDEPEPWQERVFFPCAIAERTTQWERGVEPMTRYTITAPHALTGSAFAEGADYDPYGQPRAQFSVAVPRGTDPDRGGGKEPYLATQAVSERAYADVPKRFIVDRVARATTYELENDGKSTVAELVGAADDPERKTLVSQSINFYDGSAFEGLGFGELGPYGALVRTETLVMTDTILEDAYQSGDPVVDPPELPPYLDPTGARPWGSEYPAEFQSLLESLPGLAGYTYPVPDEPVPGYPVPEAPSSARGYWAATERSEYDFHGSSGAGRGLRLASMDALGRKTLVSYEGPFDALPLATTDPVRLETRAKNDYRVWARGR